MRLGIFGGTFNPIHTGHITASLKFYDEAGLDKLLVIPDRIPPHKEGFFAPAEDRLEMVRAVYGDREVVGERCIEVSDMEIKREGRSYTILTLRALSAEYPEAELFLYTGSDMFYTLEAWFEGESILRMCSVVTAAREEGERGRLKACAEKYRERYGTRCLVMNYSPVVLSSTEIREYASAGLDKNSPVFTKKLLTDGVAEYIMRKGLYREQ